MMITIATICLAVWLLLMGLDQAMGLKFGRKNLILGILAIIAGAVQLLTLIK
jgi:hypothetical protein